MRRPVKKKLTPIMGARPSSAKKLEERVISVNFVRMTRAYGKLYYSLWRILKLYDEQRAHSTAYIMYQFGPHFK